MKVAELIAQLQRFDPEVEVSITDGMQNFCYTTNDLEIQMFEDVDGKMYLDIGIGADLDKNFWTGE
jgi:hypothetical protein